MAKNNYF